jgi:CheY-like chemotaxis protein
LAEDNLVNQKLATGVLQQQGHHVTVARTGKDALQHWEVDPIDLILMDVQMPEMDGFEATRLIREKERQTGKHIPIIAMTARAMKGDRERCLEAGMDDYLAKPIHIQEVARKIAEVIGRKDASREAGSTDLTDGDRLDLAAALRSVNGDPQLLREVAVAFLVEVPQLLQTMQSDVARGDFQALRERAHGMKGSLLFLRVREASQTSEQLETLSSDANSDEALALLDQLADQLEPIFAALRAYINAP